MKRLDILSSIEDVDADEQAEAIRTAIDHLERKFNEIRDLLASLDFNSLDNIIDAHAIADSVSTDLY